MLYWKPQYLKVNSEKKIMTNVSKGSSFELEVEQLLKLKGYSISRNELINGTQIDIIAKRNELLENICFVVECTDRDVPVGVDLVKQKAAVLLSLAGGEFLFRLMFVARNGFTAEAKAFASSQATVLLLTLTDLENQLVDFTPYINSYLHNYEKSSGMFKEGKLIDHYVELTARDEQNRIIPLFTQEVKNWLRDESNNLLFLLGEYGAGKTSFSRHLVYELIDEKYRKKQAQRYIPIIINLRDHRGGAPNFQQVITDTLVNLYGVHIHSFMAFEHLCSNGNILLVLDGFDEMTDKSDKQTLIDCFNQIYLLATLNTKIILTCRSNFFRSHSDVIELLKHFSITLPSSNTRNNSIVQLSFGNHGRVLYVEKLNRKQIGEFIKARFGDDAESILTKIESIHDLSDLSTRPVLLDMILTTLPELLNLNKRINSAALYEHYTDRWTARDDWRVKIPLKIRQNFCEILAWVLHNAKMQEVDHIILEKALIKSLQKMVSSTDQLDKFKNDLQTCSFLVRVSNDDKFRFAHKSFLEYFVARKIITDLSQGLPISKTDMSNWTEKTKKEVAEPNEDLLDYLFRRDDFETYGTNNYIFAFNLLKNRIKRSDGFLTLIDNEIARNWSDYPTDNAVRSHFEQQIYEVINKNKWSDVSVNLGISEEIATFAIEYLENLEIPLKTFISKLKDNESIIFFGDILRLGKSNEFIKREQRFLKEFLRTNENEILKISFSAALAKVPGLVDINLVKELRKTLNPDGWSYFLFELSNQGNAYTGILKECYEWSDLSTVDKVICMYGMKGSLPKDQSALITENLISKLLSSSQSDEINFGLTLCQSMSLPINVLLKLMNSVLQSGCDRKFKEQAIVILTSLQGKNVWQFVRQQWSKEKDQTLKNLLIKAEQQIRDATSNIPKSHQRFDQINANRVIRDRLWQSLK